jgi:DNA polymerase I
VSTKPLKLNYDDALIFDLEANGLLREATRIHCISIDTIARNSPTLFTGNSILEALEALKEAPIVVGHNIQGYDIPLIRKLHPELEPRGVVRDTIVMSRLQRVHQRMQHSLQSWGITLKFPKGDYNGGWEVYNDEMGAYCCQDTAVARRALIELLKESYPEECYQLEHEFSKILDWQMAMGVPFDEEAACKLAQELEADMETFDGKLRKTILPHRTPFTPKANNSRYGYQKGVTIVKEKPFNLGSRPQVIKFLKSEYGWAPVEFTEKKNPKLTGEILRQLPYPEAPILANYFDAKKLSGQLISGDKAWLKKIEGGRLYGRINHNGAVTGRCTHSNPNLSQVPRVTSYRGSECRALFKAETGFVLVGCDAAGLELRNLGHYMSPYDGGKYVRTILEGDIHKENQTAAGLPTRDNAKTFIYAHNYGAGDAKLGSIVAPDSRFEKKKSLGAGLRAQFMIKLPALKMVIDQVKAVGKNRGYLIGLDGRRLYVRSEHRALNTLLQGAGAVIMKEATVLQWKKVIGDDLNWRDYMQGDYLAYPVLHSHDETQNMVRDSYKEDFKQISEWAIAQAGINFDYKCPLEGEAKEGATWSETH